MSLVVFNGARNDAAVPVPRLGTSVPRRSQPYFGTYYHGAKLLRIHGGDTDVDLH